MNTETEQTCALGTVGTVSGGAAEGGYTCNVQRAM